MNAGAPEPTDILELWLVDDTPEHHATARASVAEMPAIRLTSFLEAPAALERYTQLARGEGVPGGAQGLLPRVVLMDFFLGRSRGDRVARDLRQLQPAHVPLIIVGYSSMPAASKAIVEAGGTLVIRKMRDASGRNPLLMRYLQELLAGPRYRT